MIQLDDIYDVKVYNYGSNDVPLFSVVYKRYEEDDWYANFVTDLWEDLFEDPSEELCELIVETILDKVSETKILGTTYLKDGKEVKISFNEVDDFLKNNKDNIEYKKLLNLTLTNKQEDKLNRLSKFLNLSEEEVIYYLLDHVPLIESTRNYFMEKRRSSKGQN